MKLIRDGLIALDKASVCNVEVNTVDKYQGRDKDVIILSLVRSNSFSDCGELLKDKRRVNVALTRAKKKLIIFGSIATLKNDTLLSKLISLIQENFLVHNLIGSPPLSNDDNGECVNDLYFI